MCSFLNYQALIFSQERKKKFISSDFPGNMELMTHSSAFLLPSTSTTASAAVVDNSTAVTTYVLIILNQRLPSFTPELWNHAQLRICADGGANRLHDELPSLFPNEEEEEEEEEDILSIRKKYKPDVIIGDMDSVRDDVLSFYSNLGTKIVNASHDQDTTDLHKCVAYIHNLEKTNLRLLVVGALGGRFDHEIGNINVLCRFSTTRIILLNDDCQILLLPSTHRHEIHVDPSVEGPHCGLVPIVKPSTRNSTTGLQWDLNNTEMKFGGLVSTSNIVKAQVVTVHSDSDLLWTISLKKGILK